MFESCSPVFSSREVHYKCKPLSSILQPSVGVQDALAHRWPFNDDPMDTSLHAKRMLLALSHVVLCHCHLAS